MDDFKTFLIGGIIGFIFALVLMATTDNLVVIKKHKDTFYVHHNNMMYTLEEVK